MLLKELKLEIIGNIIIPRKTIQNSYQWVHYQSKGLGPMSIVVNYFGFFFMFKLKCLYV